MENSYRPNKSEFKNFSPYAVNVSDVEFKGDPDSLRDFPQWVWYTVAAPVLWGRLDDRVLSAMQQETELTYHRRVFEKPIFSGFGSVWDCTLWAVPQVDWPAFRGLMVKYGLQELVIYDPVAVDKDFIISHEVPTLKIYAFGVMSNIKTIAFNPAQKLVERPRVYTFKAEERIISLSDKTHYY